MALPWVCSPGRLPSPGWSLVALIVLWCLYHLLQYLATVALWSWLADVAPRPIRGRFLGRRERWIVAGQAVAAIDAGLFVWGIRIAASGHARLDRLCHAGVDRGRVHDGRLGAAGADAIGRHAVA